MAAHRGHGSATPATRALDRAGVAYQLHGFEHDPDDRHFGDEAVDKLDLPADRIFKTLVVEIDGAASRSQDLAVGVVSLDAQLDLKAMAHALGVKRCHMADPQLAQRRTGYVVGGISPLGQKSRLPIFVDDGARSIETMLVSGGQRGLDVELAPDDLCSVTGARYAPIAKRD